MDIDMDFDIDTEDIFSGVKDLGAESLAAITAFVAVVTGAVGSHLIFSSGVTRAQLIVMATVAVFIVFATGVLALLRGLFIGVEAVDENTAFDAFKHPTVLFVTFVLMLGAGAVVGIYYRYLA